MKQLIVTLLAVGLIGCSSLDNPCNDQGAGHCASVTTAYENSLKTTVNPTDLPRGQDVSTSNGSMQNYGSKVSLSDAYKLQNSYSQIPQSGDALRTSTKTMRVWILPYEDDVGLYHDQQYVYAVTQRGTWMFKSVSNNKSQNSYANTVAAGNVKPINYQPFVAKESDVIANNQNLISGLGNSSSSPFSTQGVANKNASAINSISSAPSGN